MALVRCCDRCHEIIKGDNPINVTLSDKNVSGEHWELCKDCYAELRAVLTIDRTEILTRRHLNANKKGEK